MKGSLNFWMIKMFYLTVVYIERDLALNLHFFEDNEDVLFILLFLLQGQKRYCGQAVSCSFTS